MTHHSGILVLLFIVFSLILGAAVRHGLKNTTIPYTITLLVIGLLLGFAGRSELVSSQPNLLNETINFIADIDPHLILFLFLPTLIFESAFAIETHLFRRTFNQIAILAVPGLILSTMLTAVLVKYLFPWDWSWPICLMFGALVSATDPVAVVALLKEMSSRKRLETLIEGESLLNDGTAIVIFTLFYGMLSVTNGGEFNLLTVIGEFSWVVSFGLFIGLVLGWLSLVWIGKVFNDPMIEITLSIAIAYLVFYIAEHTFHVSGVVAVVTLAIIFASFGRTRISPEVAGFLHHFWEMMAHIANTLIFLLCGIIIAKTVQLNDPQAWIALAILYVGVLVIRAISVITFTPILKRIGLGITKEKSIVLIWGGLRGAVALALALSVAQDDNFAQDTGDQILFLCAGIVVLTILINGGTFRWLLTRLGLSELPPGKQATVAKARKNVDIALNQMMAELKDNELMSYAQWDKIEQDLHIGKATEQSADSDTPSNGGISANQPQASQQDLNIAFKRRLLESERKQYWQQYNDGILSRQAVKVLIAVVEEALDGEPVITPRPGLEKHWRFAKTLELWSQTPVLNTLSRSITFDHLKLSYDVARGFLLAQQILLKEMAQIAPDESMLHQAQQEVEQNITIINDNIAQIRNGFPNIVTKLETHVASRLLLNRKRKVIHQLADSGVLDKPEAERLTGEVEQQMQDLR
ncbi:MAG: NhaP-type Na+/H+ or K+/H+ antiporter [Phenylobacterium sp.]|jgi:NhaP-type Na+/H+ or K+/H+ antiporter